MVRKRMTRAVASAVDRLLRAAGYDDDSLGAANDVAIDTLKTREQAILRRRRVVRGHAIEITGPGRVRLHPVERLLAGPNELTVETVVTAISPGTERAQWLRLPNARPPFPYTPGYSGVGRVIAAGPGTDVELGRLVAVAQLPHASVATVPRSSTSVVPEGVPVEDAALVYLAIIAGYGVRRAGPMAGTHVAVAGVGPIGALALQLAALERPSALTVVATSTRRRAVAERAGADFRTTAEDLDGIDADIVIEATGDPDAIADAVTMARPGARIVLLGSARGTTAAFPVAEVQGKQLRLVGAHISMLAKEAKRDGTPPFTALADRFLDALAAGHLDVAELRGAGVDPREPGHVYRQLAAGELPAAHFDWRRLPAEMRPRRIGRLAPPALPTRQPTSAPVSTPIRSSPSGRLRFAVLGCGDIGLSNAKAIAAADSAELVTSFDVVPALAEAAAAAHGGSVAPTIESALDPDRVDAVFISVPHDQHEPLVRQAAEAGLHVVVEKPLGLDLASARAAADAAERAGVVLSVCFPFRYEPAILTARRFVDEGALGRFRGAAIVFHADKPDSYWLGGYSGRAASDWRMHRDRSGGGVLIMSITHHIDFLRHLTGAEASLVMAVARPDDPKQVEDAISVAIQFEGGGVGTVFGSASTSGSPTTHFELWGETGTIRLEPNPAIFTERAVDGLTTGRWTALPDAEGSKPRVQFVERFATAVLEGRPPDVTVADALAVQAVVEAAYRSVELRAPVSPASLLETPT